MRAKNLPKIRKKRGKIQEKSGKRGNIGKKRQTLGRSFTLPLLTDKAGYATECYKEDSLSDIFYPLQAFEGGFGHETTDTTLPLLCG